MTEITIKYKTKITKITMKLKYDQTTLRKENDHNTLTKENDHDGSYTYRISKNTLRNLTKSQFGLVCRVCVVLR